MLADIYGRRMEQPNFSGFRGFSFYPILIIFLKKICFCCRRDAVGHVTNLEGVLALEDTDYKNTPKLTWLAKVESATPTPTVIVHFDHLITKGVLKPGEDFKDFVNRDSMVGVVFYL